MGCIPNKARGFAAYRLLLA